MAMQNIKTIRVVAAMSLIEESPIYSSLKTTFPSVYDDITSAFVLRLSDSSPTWLSTPFVLEKDGIWSGASPISLLLTKDSDFSLLNAFIFLYKCAEEGLFERFVNNINNPAYHTFSGSLFTSLRNCPRDASWVRT
jgi:hypothetical protein